MPEVRLAESVNEGPVRSFLGRLLNLYDDKIAARVLRDDMRGGEVAFLPAVGLLHQLAFRVVNVDGNLRRFDFGPQPEPILVSLEQLLRTAFFSPAARSPPQ